MENEILSRKRCDVILALAECRMNPSDASRMLGIHRNTVIYQIGRIKQLTGKDPLCFYDLHDLVQYVKAESQRAKIEGGLTNENR